MLSNRATEPEIKGHAIWSAGRARTLLYSIEKRQSFTTADDLTAQLNSLAADCQARPVAVDVSLSGRIARMSDPQWWSRNIRPHLLVQNEIAEHAGGNIRRKGQCYVSDHACQAKRQRRKANRVTLEALEVCNELGTAVNLQEVADASVSNPKLRRNELMVRCRGFEEAAKYSDHSAVFITLTCPSRFHRFNGVGQPNKKWDGSTAKDGQKYLCRTWAKVRAAWKRAGYMPYGFRVAEPHHDGCPHWHILLFCQSSQAGWFDANKLANGQGDFGAGILGIAGRYSLQDCPKESGATQHRFTVKYINPNEGSATGYIAKYICKNIDGLRDDGISMGLDYASGQDAAAASARVRDWASTWGIRQFQQIGGPSVTVWRELRRLREVIQQPLYAPFDWEALRAAADRSLWALFWVLQGGPDVPKTKLSLKPLYMDDGQGKYGDPVSRVLGVVGRADGGEFALRTRMHTWTIQRAGTAQINASDLEQKDWMRSNKRVREFERAAGLPVRSDIRFPMDFSSGQGEALSPWTRVNNCTRPERTESERRQIELEVAFAEYDFKRINETAWKKSSGFDPRYGH